MTSRIYVMSQKEDSRAGLFLKSWNSIGFKGKISNVTILDSYLIEGGLTEDQIKQSAQALTNERFEQFLINELPASTQDGPKANFSYIIEIGFLPGVTDNVAHTTKETIIDLLHLKEGEQFEVYTSKVYLISGKITKEDAKQIASLLHNPLIEQGNVFEIKDIIKPAHPNGNSEAGGKNNLPLKIPKVILPKEKQVIKVSLNVSDEELVKIGKEGIKNEDGGRRGPLALDLESMKVIQKYFKEIGRDPNDIELESLAQTWSEHCKHTIFANPIDDIKDGLYKTYIKGATNKIRKEKGKDDFCVSVFSDNSGGIIFDKDYLVTHKVETHNSPSALDPFGGAITGIVGVNRDTIGFGLGAKPVANMYGFCFGDPYDTRALYKDKNLTEIMLPPKRIMDGVIKGVNVGGNCSGIPTVSGFVKYDDLFRGKPLVFVGTVGIIPQKINGKLSHEKEAQNGDLVVVVGGRVGADGIHGATFSSVAMDSTSPKTAVQIGDPITQKKLSDAIVKEARGMDLYTSITDNGAGGISCSIAEMAKECGGVEVDLEKVPLKYPGLKPWQIWISESQERMTLAVPKEKWQKFKDLMNSRGVEATVVGKFTNSGKCIVRHNNEEIMNISLEFLHNGLPKTHLESSPIIHNNKTPKTPSIISRTKVFEELLKDKNISGFSFISSQYDHEVQASSVLKPLDGKGMINTEAEVFRPVLSSEKGVVVSSGLYPTYSFINTYHMAACAIDTAIRNAICAGGSLSNLAILDNFCWCSSYDKTKLWELIESLKACYDYSTLYGTPFISGKDSMFNDFRGYDEKGSPVAISIPPTLLISAIGVMPDVYKTVSPSFKKSGDNIYIIGETFDELGGSEYYKMLSKKENNDASLIGNDVPKVNALKNIKIYKAIEKAIFKELLSSSISVNGGGLAISLAKASIGGGFGCNITLKNLPGNYSNIDSALFSESQGRILVSVSNKNVKEFEKLMKGITYAKLGKIKDDDKFIITDKKGIRVVDTNIKKLFNLYHDFSNKMK